MTTPSRPHLRKLAALSAAVSLVTLAHGAAQVAVSPAPTPARAAPANTGPTVLGQPTPEQAQRIIERLSGQNYGPNGAAQVIYGALPENLPLKLSGPLETLVSFRFVYGSNVLYRVMLSSSAAQAEALTALDTQFQASGWKRFSGGQGFGFMGNQNTQYRMYYRETPGGKGEGYVANVNTVPREGRTDIDLQMNSAPAAQIASYKNAPMQAQSSLPPLHPLPGAQIRVGYGGGGQNGLINSAYITGTTLSANEVLSFYNAQLKKAGWKALTDTTSGPLRVITYALKDVNGREALGTLSIRPWEKEGGGYVLNASVQGFKPW